MSARESSSTALRRLATGMAIALSSSGRPLRDVAKICDISSATLSKILAGRKNPGPVVLEQFATVVGHTIGEIYAHGHLALERESDAARRTAIRRAVHAPSSSSIFEAARFLEKGSLQDLLERLGG